MKHHYDDYEHMLLTYCFAATLTIMFAIVLELWILHQQESLVLSSAMAELNYYSDLNAEKILKVDKDTVARAMSLIYEIEAICDYALWNFKDCGLYRSYVVAGQYDFILYGYGVIAP